MRIPSRKVGFHACPHCRRPGVPDAMWACGNCWRMLSAPARLAILSTARLHILHPLRRAAMDGARADYAAAVARRRNEIESRKSGESNV